MELSELDVSVKHTTESAESWGKINDALERIKGYEIANVGPRFNFYSELIVSAEDQK